MPPIIPKAGVQRLELYQYNHLLLKTVTLSLPQSLPDLTFSSATSHWIGFMLKTDPQNQEQYYCKKATLYFLYKPSGEVGLGLGLGIGIGIGIGLGSGFQG